MVTKEFKPIEAFIEAVEDAYKNKKAFSATSMAEVELLFLMYPELTSDIKNIDINSVPGLGAFDDVKKEILNKIHTNDFIFTQNIPSNAQIDEIKLGGIMWKQFSYRFWDFMEAYDVNNPSVVDIDSMYGMFYDGTFMDAIKGAKVLLVGYFAPIVEAFWERDDFLSHYEAYKFNSISIVGSVVCKPTHTVAEIPYLVEAVQKYDADIILVGSAGIAADYICPTLKENGKIAIDIGNVMAALAGKGDPNKSAMAMLNYTKYGVMG